MKSREDLLAASNYVDKPHDFDDLLRILDGELRLITPTDPEGAETEGSGVRISVLAGQDSDTLPEPTPAKTEIRTPDPAVAASRARYYQLTHDYLVPSLREWLTSKQKETWRGRAELRLEERAAQWTRAQESRFLPNPFEYLSIVAGVPHKNRKPEERAIMRAATRYHGARWGSGLGVLLLAAIAIQQYVVSVRRSSAEQRTKTLIDGVMGTSAAGVPFAIENLKPFRELALPMLRARLADGSTAPIHRLHMAMALAALGEVEKPEQDILLDGIATAAADECQNIMTALEPVKQDVVRELAERASRETDTAVRARLATTALYLGEPEPAQQVVALAADPTYRIAFVHGLKSWNADHTKLPETLLKTEDSAFRAGVCAALGLMSPESLSVVERKKLLAMFKDLYSNARDGATHSAAGFALRKWKAQCPAIEPSREAPKDRRWFLNRHDMTMLEVPAGTFTLGDDDKQSYNARPPHEVTLTRSFFMSDREVWSDLFQQFVDDPDYPATEKPAGWTNPFREDRSTGDTATIANWFDAVLFCNWLSHKEGRNHPYKRTGKQKTKVGNTEEEWDVWECDFDANGYRLPTEAEWEYACRAGTTTAYEFGNDDELLPLYGFYANNSNRHPWPGREKLPNGWGLFDMYGNQWEWCWDWLSPYTDQAVTDPRGPKDGNSRLRRGGGWDIVFWDCRSASRFSTQPSLRYTNYGVRVVCGVVGQDSKRKP